MPPSIADDVAAIARIDAVARILEVVCRTTGMGFAAVARVTEDRWVACAVRDEIDFGLKPGGELAVKTTICDEIRDSGRAVVIDHVAEDSAFHGHHTPAQYGFQSYISAPIMLRGQFFGTLCAIDPNPARLTDTKALAMFELFAELIAAHLDAEQRVAQSEAALLDQREAAELREQFIAVLGHDLRNPLASIDAAGRLMKKTPLNDRAVALVDMMHQSVGRMAGLIDNVLDLARGRLGGGFVAERRAEPELARALEQVVTELRMGHPERRIDADIRFDRVVNADGRRLAQLLSNLIANALAHGSDSAPVKVRGVVTGDVLELSVANAGEPIPEAARERLFQPFSRAIVRPKQQGLGLGLWIAAEIAKAHDGAIEVTSDAKETRFTLRMPLAAAPAPAVAIPAE
ncbi:MAG: GAF domain-containing sensor histidine kinase [Alphaproteobacteria bacterium]|nr:GAF domain-containing sensor histidine kinase [Alphaproteobacteria bacterium]MBU1514888.1 GAF domain-containing sensor histidine kinase [Alphaproteobacteria bacterium]MBU2093809.1 GAF domain-containing sensor histidine kinase [Alphaproteobacteria bacterium]MBU2149430.1 GAF domain-containing sensor histidine kinase [Alphaproteobacteria bacterium]MBU2305390.1 GAF domain-containing sensor histidine kinase [Alphaproteobacteria bacterium]